MHVYALTREELLNPYSWNRLRYFVLAFAPLYLKVYGVEWEVDEDDYVLYNDWEATDAQRLDMLLFDGIKGFSRCCAQ